MAETGWTPGEWDVDDPYRGRMRVGVFADRDVDREGGPQAELYLIPVCEIAESDEAEANAHLIAAAPDLYAALEHMTAFIQKWVNPSAALPYNHHTALRALARARGESQ